jgi:hypothetical protein
LCPVPATQTIVLPLNDTPHTLPWKAPPQEVHEHIAQGLHIIPPALLNTQMGVNTGVTRCSSQVLVLAVWDVDVGLWVPVLLCQPEINDMDLVCLPTQTHDEVVRLNIALSEATGVDKLDS